MDPQVSEVFWPGRLFGLAFVLLGIAVAVLFVLVIRQQIRRFQEVQRKAILWKIQKGDLPPDILDE